MLVDTHCHIYLSEFENDRAAMIERALKEDISQFYMPAIDSSTHQDMLNIQSVFKHTAFAMMGLHPCSVKENYAEELIIAQQYLEKGKFIAIGETGLDFYWDLTFTEQQYDAFHQQIEWALQYQIPVVIHSRNSLNECINVVAEHQQGGLKGVFHCFSGNAEQANKITDLGFYLGIGGVLTFKNSGLDNVIKQSDLSHIVLETDAPYLAPVPFRGKRNECMYMKYVAEKLAAIKKIDVNEVAGITTGNAKKLFGC